MCIRRAAMGLSVAPLLAIPMFAADQPLLARVKASVAILYSQDEEGSMHMRCTTTAFKKTSKSYLFVSAAHCLGDDDGRHETSAPFADLSLYVTFDEVQAAKTFYPADVVLVGYQQRGDDFCVLEVKTQETWTIIPLGDEKQEQDGAIVINVASPRGLGLQVFRGTISSLYVDRPLMEGGINWKGSMLLQITAGPGSSGSAIVSERQEAIVGFVVGVVGQNNVVAIPVSRFKAVRRAFEDGKYKWFVDVRK